MEFRQIAHCKKTLDFKPVQAPRIIQPTFSWGELLLSGFELSSETSVIDLKQISNFKTWHQAMASLYLDLSFIEFSRLYQCVQAAPKLNQPNWPRSFGFNDKQESIELCELLVQMPQHFQLWAAEKKLSLRELRPLKLLKNMPEDFIHFDFVAINKYSRTEGAYALELLVELLLMEAPQAKLAEIFNQSADKALEQLRKLRYPLRAQKQDLMIQKAQSLSWPRRSQSKWNFLKDSPSLELKFLIHNEQEFHQIVDQLNEIKSKISEDSSNPWK